ncbi:MAG: universal stress protein [Rhodobacteraceae bacterium]|nr:MAG: universal stress protein [Paracoccaceae bacterium]
MFDTILLPIDLNHPASWEKSLPMARKLAGETGTIHVLGIVHDLGAAMVAAYLPADYEKQALDRMKRELEGFIATHMSGVKSSLRVGHGHVPEAILLTARKIDADMIVMASAPPDDFRTFLVGSNADKVVRHSTLPVLVVR